MTFFEAAMEVLRKSKKPLTTDEVFDRITQLRLVKSSGKTPKSTLSAELYRHANDDSGLVKLSEPSKKRARTGSVRWTVDSGSAGR